MADIALYFKDVTVQVAVLFVMIGVGVLITKIGMLKENGAKQLTDIILFVVTPAVIIKAFMSIEFSPLNLGRMLTAFVSAVICHLIAYGIGSLCFIKLEKTRKAIATGCVIFSNGGYMSIPLAAAILGDMGVFLVSVYVAVFNVFLWTLGLKLFSNEKISFKKIVLNPNIIALVVGIILFFVRADITSVDIVYAPISNFAALNAPLAMIIIGYHLSNSSIKFEKGDGVLLSAVALKIIAIPLIMILLLWFAGVRGAILTGCVIPASAPTAAAVTMFVTRFGGDARLSSKALSVSHILSIVTIPIMLTICEIIG